jgi:hypothetical protein
MNGARAAIVRTFTLVCCLLAATACDEANPTGPTVRLSERFVLAPGSVAAIADARIGVQFVGVTGDSRCPADVLCIQGGDAVVHVRVLDAGAVSSYELHTGDGQRAGASHRSLRIELLELQPYPFSSRTIDASDYRATFIVARAA